MQYNGKYTDRRRVIDDVVTTTTRRLQTTNLPTGAEVDRQNYKVAEERATSKLRW